MKIRVYSDIHAELQRDYGHNFVNKCPVDDVDVLVLAGNIATLSFLRTVVGTLCKRFDKAQVLLVPGESEYFGAKAKDVYDCVDSIASEYGNLMWLDNSSIIHNGVMFTGYCPWPSIIYLEQFRARIGEDNWGNRLDDHDHAMKGILANMHDNMITDAVVITHLPPVPPPGGMLENVGPSPNLPLDYVEMVLKYEPSVWIHGGNRHTYQHQVQDTLMCCNAMGSEYDQPNTRFDAGFTFTLPVRSGEDVGEAHPPG